MSLRKQHAEIRRLIDAFSAEAGKFHDITFSVFVVTQSGPSSDKKFVDPNHAIVLWQYYGAIQPGSGVDDFVDNLRESDPQWGVRGAKLSSFGVIEGRATPLFVRMAKRAGSLFSEKEALKLNLQVTDDIVAHEKKKYPSGKPTVASNSNPLALWLNYLLYHISMTAPGRKHAQKIEPDPFSLSLVALESLALDPVIGRVDQSVTALEKIKFKVALSFPGERRTYVSKVARILIAELGSDSVFYDFDYQAQLARPNMDVLLQKIYRSNSDLVVVFLCSEYGEKQWCGLEWRAVRDIIKSRENHRVMFIRFDDANIEGVFSIDGYIDAKDVATHEVANLILQRVAACSSCNLDKEP